MQPGQGLESGRRCSSVYLRWLKRRPLLVARRELVGGEGRICVQTISFVSLHPGGPHRAGECGISSGDGDHGMASTPPPAIERRLVIAQRVAPFACTISDEPLTGCNYQRFSSFLEFHFGAAKLNETLTPLSNVKPKPPRTPWSGEIYLSTLGRKYASPRVLHQSD